jgi:hypothetical protein
VNKTQYERDGDRISRRYRDVMAKRCAVSGVASQAAETRLTWQMAELKLFIGYCLRFSPSALAKEPVKVPSGKYTETLIVERTQQDLINEMAMELASLPQYTAYAKLIAEQNGVQQVLKHKIQTLPLPQALRGAEIEHALLEKSHALCKERDAIEAEIRERQERWRPRSTQQPPDEPPPPTGFQRE